MRTVARGWVAGERQGVLAVGGEQRQGHSQPCLGQPQGWLGIYKI